MSRNDQILIKEHKGKFYVFDVMAESWSDDNEISLNEARFACDTYEEALIKAHEFDESDEYGGSEYGVHRRLAKDGGDVKVVEASTTASEAVN